MKKELPKTVLKNFNEEVIRNLELRNKKIIEKKRKFNQLFYIFLFLLLIPAIILITYAECWEAIVHVILEAIPAILFLFFGVKLSIEEDIDLGNLLALKVLGWILIFLGLWLYIEYIIYALIVGKIFALPFLGTWAPTVC